MGEIHKYVQDGVNTYMVEPCDPIAYADKLRYILSHPDEAAAVAENAYSYASENFCSKPVTKGLLDFLNSIEK